MKYLLLLAALLTHGFTALAQAPAAPSPRAQQRADSARFALKRRVGTSPRQQLRPATPMGRPGTRRNPAIIGHLL